LPLLLLAENKASLKTENCKKQKPLTSHAAASMLSQPSED
jgi:hypothetical protein